MKINKEEFIKGTIDFIKEFGRFPFLGGDKILIIEIENNERQEKYYSADKYMKEYFGSKNKLIEYFFDKCIDNKFISGLLKIEENRLVDLLDSKSDNITKEERRKLHMFLGKDLYEKQLGKYNIFCTSCPKKCKQSYHVDTIGCGIFKKLKEDERKNKKKKK